MGIRVSKFRANEVAVYPSAFCREGESIWYSLGGVSLLMRYDMTAQKSEIISYIPNERPFRSWNYEAIFKHREKIFLIPSKGNEIAVYNTKNKKINKITLKGYDRKRHENVLMFSEKLLVKRNKLYCFPAGFEYITVIDMEDDTIEYLFNVHDALKSAGLEFVDSYGSWAEPHENGFYALWNGCSYIWNWSITDNSLTYTPFWPERIHNEGLAYLPPYFIIYSPRHNHLFRYDLRKPQYGFMPFDIENIKIENKQWNLRTFGNSLVVLSAEDDAEDIFFDANGRLYRYEAARRPVHVFGSFGCGNYRGRVGQGVEARNIFYDSVANGYLIVDGKNKNADIFLPNTQNISPKEMRTFLCSYCDKEELNKQFNDIRFYKYGLKWLISDVVNGATASGSGSIVENCGKKIYDSLNK